MCAIYNNTGRFRKKWLHRVLRSSDPAEGLLPSLKSEAGAPSYMLKNADIKPPYQPTNIGCSSPGKPLEESPNCRPSSRITILYPSSEDSLPTSQTVSSLSITRPSRTVRTITGVIFGGTRACRRVIPWSFLVDRWYSLCERISSRTWSTVILNRSPSSLLRVINLRPLQFVGVIHIHRLPRTEEVDRPQPFPVPVAGMFHAAEG